MIKTEPNSSLAPTVLTSGEAATLTATIIDSSPPDGGTIDGFSPNLPADLKALGVLGKGGMGWVVRAYQQSLEREVAVKVINPRYSENARFTSMLMQEARILARLTHPNIVQIYQVGMTDSGSIFIVMELVEGDTLAVQAKERAKQAKEGGAAKQQRRLSSIFSIMFQLCDALEAAHLAGIIHRDVKPANIQIDQEGRVRLMDFGLALLANPDGQAPMAAGTPSYMAPEQALAPAEVDHRSDIFALGGVLFFLITGRPPRKAKSFSGMTKGVVNNLEKTARDSFIPLGIPQRLISVMEKALKLKPQNRYPSVSDFRLALEGAYLADVRPTLNLLRLIRRHIILVLLGTVLLTAAAVNMIPRGSTRKSTHAALLGGSGPLRIAEAEREIDLRLANDGLPQKERELLISWKKEIAEFQEASALTRVIEIADYAKHFIERAQLEDLAQIIVEMSDDIAIKSGNLGDEVERFIREVQEFRASGTDYKDLPDLRAKGMQLIRELQALH